MEEQIRQIVDREIRKYLSTTGFVGKKITDLPTEGFSIVSRNYVNLNGTSSNRPIVSVLGQRYFDTTIGKPIYWSGTSWVDGSGSVT